MTVLPSDYEEDEAQRYTAGQWQAQPMGAVGKPTHREAPEFASCMTWSVPQVSVGQPIQVLQRQPQRFKAKFTITSPGSLPIVVSQPSVPASGTAVQNTNSFPVTVVVSGFTATQTFVNGILVGAGNGTYTVPAGGSISITYTVAGAWVWSTTSTTPGVLIFNSKLDPLQGLTPQGFSVSAVGSLNMPDWESQQPLYVISTGTGGSISVVDETYAVR